MQTESGRTVDGGNPAPASPAAPELSAACSSISHVPMNITAYAHQNWQILLLQSTLCVRMLLWQSAASREDANCCLVSHRFRVRQLPDADGAAVRQARRHQLILQVRRRWAGGRRGRQVLALRLRRAPGSQTLIRLRQWLVPRAEHLAIRHHSGAVHEVWCAPP
jgi:hypothetical protein